MKFITDTIETMRAFAKEISERRIFIYSSSGTYYLFMSLIPTVMLLCSFLQFTSISQEMLMAEIVYYLPESVHDFVDTVISTVYTGGSVAVTVSTALTIWSASASTKSLMRGMDEVYRVKRQEGYIMLSIRACFYMIGVIAIILFTLVFLVYGPSILELIINFFPYSEILHFIFDKLTWLRYPITFTVMIFMFMLLYKFLPARKMPYKSQFVGAVFTAIMWLGFSGVFSFYVAHSERLGAYGYIGTIMIAMIWMQYCIFFLLVGGHINCRLMDWRASAL